MKHPHICSILATLVVASLPFYSGCQRDAVSTKVVAPAKQRAIAQPSIRSADDGVTPAQPYTLAPTPLQDCIVAAGLDEIGGRPTDQYMRIYVSLDEVLEACPRIAAAAEERWPAETVSASSDFRHVVAMGGDACAPPDDCSPAVTLQDIVVRFEADETCYEVTLQSPYLCDGRVCGYLDVPIPSA